MIVKEFKTLLDFQQDLEIYKTIDYFNLANAAYETYKDNLRIWSEEEGRNEEQINKFISAASAMYSHWRICLAMIERIKEKYKLKSNLDEYAEWKSKFIRVRNYISSHPISSEKKLFSEIISFQSDWELQLQCYNLNTLEIIENQKIVPYSDYKKLHEYIEKFAALFKIWRITSSTSP